MKSSIDKDKQSIPYQNNRKTPQTSEKPSNNTEKSNLINDHKIKYEKLRPIMEKVMSNEIQKIESIIDNIYESCIDIYEREEDEDFEEYSFSYFNFEDEIIELFIDQRDNNDIVKLMYILSYHLGAIIRTHKDNFYLNYSNHANLKNDIYSQMLKDNTIPSSTNTTNSNNHPLKSYQIQTKEFAFINKIPKEICYVVLEDLFTSYDFISKVIELVCTNFQVLINRYFEIVKTDTNIIKIFLEDFSTSLLEDHFFKVS